LFKSSIFFIPALFSSLLNYDFTLLKNALLSIESV